MKPNMLGLVNEKIDNLVLDEEQAERIKERLATIAEEFEQSPPPLVPISDDKFEEPELINMFNLCASLCAAAFCVGSNPNSVKPKEIATNARAVASNLFTEDGKPVKKFK